MIRDVEIRGRARRLGVDIELIRKDHVLNHVLAAVAEVANDITFRGGTALARIYWPDFRISEDLDFLVEGKLAKATELVYQAVGIAAARTELESYGRVQSSRLRYGARPGRMGRRPAGGRPEQSRASRAGRRAARADISPTRTSPEMFAGSVSSVLRRSWPTSGTCWTIGRKPATSSICGTGSVSAVSRSIRLRTPSGRSTRRSPAYGASNGRGSWRQHGRSGSPTRSTTSRPSRRFRGGPCEGSGLGGGRLSRARSSLELRGWASADGWPI
jgi:hypothetical protein